MRGVRDLPIDLSKECVQIRNICARIEIGRFDIQGVLRAIMFVGSGLFLGMMPPVVIGMGGPSHGLPFTNVLAARIVYYVLTMFLLTLVADPDPTFRKPSCIADCATLIFGGCVGLFFSLVAAISGFFFSLFPRVFLSPLVQSGLAAGGL